MKNILITGSEGQLGRALRKAEGDFRLFRITGIDIKDLDLTHEESVNLFFETNHFDYIINCAAFTSVDQAEKLPEKAFAVNASVPFILEKICRKHSARLIHISTDYVYNGSHSLPHTEDEPAGPESVYAQSKLEGEKSLLSSSLAMIIRTSWLYSEFGNNFLRTMIRLSGEKKEIGVVYDQTGTPTYAGDLARAIMEIIRFSEINGFSTGIFNYSNEGVCSWYDFALEIMKITGRKCEIKPIRTSEYPLPAKRPAYSVLDKTKIKRKFELKIPYWKDSLQKAIMNLENNINA